MLGRRSWRVWSCDAELLVTDPAALEAAGRIVDATLTAVGDACDRFRDDSELSRLPSGVPTRLTPMLALLVSTALEAAARTGGRCDPTLGAALGAAGYDRDIRLVLDDDRPVRVVVRPARTWEAVLLDGETLTVPHGLRLDLGATAKALAAELAADEVAAALGCGTLVNLGGDLATAGAGPEGGWQVRVQDAPGEPATQVAVADGFGLTTSSTLHRGWYRAGRRVHHIVDPVSGSPAAEVWRTVSAVAPSAVEANAATTAAVVAGADALELLHDMGVPARLVAANGAVILVNGWPPETEPDRLEAVA